MALQSNLLYDNKPFNRQNIEEIDDTLLAAELYKPLYITSIKISLVAFLITSTDRRNFKTKIYKEYVEDALKCNIDPNKYYETLLNRLSPYARKKEFEYLNIKANSLGVSSDKLMLCFASEIARCMNLIIKKQNILKNINLDPPYIETETESESDFESSIKLLSVSKKKVRFNPVVAIRSIYD